VDSALRLPTALRDKPQPHSLPLLCVTDVPVAAAVVAAMFRYVLCPGCKSVDTLLDKDSATRLMHLRCQQCGASRTVQAIKAGFVARTTKRQHTG
jgi:translation initiation factor 2 beta subunit (eIF-2beta)/eIF-5